MGIYEGYALRSMRAMRAALRAAGHRSATLRQAVAGNGTRGDWRLTWTAGGPVGRRAVRS